MNYLLTPAQLAAHLNTSERTVARMILDGCPSMLIGRRRRFDLSTVLAWAVERSCRPVRILMDVGTPKRVSADVAFTDACRRVQVRVTPRLSKPNS